jgi:hypothetical protein
VGELEPRRQIGPAGGRHRPHRRQVAEELEVEDMPELLPAVPGALRHRAPGVLPGRDRLRPGEALLQPSEGRRVARLGGGVGLDELPDPCGHLQFPAYIGVHSASFENLAGTVAGMPRRIAMGDPLDRCPASADASASRLCHAREACVDISGLCREQLSGAIYIRGGMSETSAGPGEASAS